MILTRKKVRGESLAQAVSHYKISGKLIKGVGKLRKQDCEIEIDGQKFYFED